MAFIGPLKKIYRHYIRWPWLDRQIYRIFDVLTNFYSWIYIYSFPKNYIRRWKLDMLWKLYESETVALCKKIIKPDMVVVDIGAHIGYFTRIFSKLVGTNGIVLAFEADTENFELLIKNTKHLTNVSQFHYAVCDQSGIIDFYHCVEKSGCHSILPNAQQNFTMKKITTQAIELDSFLAKQNIPKVDLIKIDIEGGELTAFKKMTRVLSLEDVKLIVEYNPETICASGFSPSKFLEKLSSFGFSLFAIMPNGLVPINSTNLEQYKSVINIYCTKHHL